MALRSQAPTDANSWASDEMTRRVMVANRGRDTKPELLLRRRVHAMGLRYRVGLTVRVAGVRVRPDLTFTRVRVAVFVDGCFWHRCPQHGCEPQTNVDYWVPKLEGNVVRDRRVDAALRAAGWTVVRVWEHEDVGAAADRVRRAVCRRTRT